MFTMIPYRAPMMTRPANPFDDDFFRPFFGRPEHHTFRVDVQDKGGSYLLEAEMPGLNKDDIHIDLEDNLLTIFVDQDETREEKDEKGYVIHERRTGRMSRAFNVEGIDKEGIQAAYENGVLKLTLPKEQPEARETKRSIAIS